MSSKTNPVRKVWKNPFGSLLLTIPKNMGIKEGDIVLFKKEGERIILEKIQV